MTDFTNIRSFLKGGNLLGILIEGGYRGFVVVVVLLFYVHGKHLRSCRDGQLI